MKAKGALGAEGVERAVDLVATLLQDVQGLLGGIQLLVAQQVLNAPQVLAILQQMSRKRVAKRVTRGTLREFGIGHGLPDGALDGRRRCRRPDRCGAVPLRDRGASAEAL